MIPNGVSRGRPPALRPPLASVWQTAQAPSAARCLPRAVVAAENTDASGRAIGAIERHGNAAAATPTTAAHNAAAVASAPRPPAHGGFHLSIASAGVRAAKGHASCAAYCSLRNPPTT